MLNRLPQRVAETLNGRKRPTQQLSRSEQAMASGEPWSPKLLHVFLQSITIATNNLVVQQLRSSRPSVLLSPRIEEYDTLEFHKGREVIQRGYDAAISGMTLVRSRLSR